jgi:outer membrane protein OmpA-like peptidoglycan-associated protein
MRASSEVEAMRSRPGPASTLLQLQRLVGNRALRGVCARPPPSRLVQRFVGTEHKKLGDTTGLRVDLGGGVVLSWGDIVALAGDEYGSLKDLLADTTSEEGKQRLRAAVEHDGIAAAAGGLPVPTDQQRSDRSKTFLELAAVNTSHFNSAGEAVARWSSDHAEAIADALQAGLSGDESKHELALAKEAFAQHFLTDAFSGGHIRTPRADIIGWYRTAFAPVVVDTFITNMATRVVDALTAQISPQTNWPDFLVRRKVNSAVGAKLATAIDKVGGKAKLIDYFALAVAGAVSGAMHDLEGKRGVVVTSEDHPQPWRAFGDDQLSDSPVTFQQAQAAIAVATGHVETAYAIGKQYGHDADKGSLASATYFGFDSADLNAVAATDISALSTFLRLRPEVQVTIVGNTDPVGTGPYNDELGMRRADAVAAKLAAAGIGSDQVSVRSDGKRNPAVTERSQYRLNRRVTYELIVRAGPYKNPLQDEAQASVAAKTGPPNAVTRFVPHPTAAAASTGALDNASAIVGPQVELEEWRWGRIPTTLRSEINTWVIGKAGPQVSGVKSAPELDRQTVEGYTVEPRPVVEAMLRELLDDPAAFLSKAFGQPMSP